jgi:hypothetical protein
MTNVPHLDSGQKEAAGQDRQHVDGVGNSEVRKPQRATVGHALNL